MKRKPVLLVCLIVFTTAGYPCGNSYHRSTNADEYVSGTNLEKFRFRRSFSNALLLEELNRITDEINSRLSLFENENDKALTYMRMGRYNEALAILQQLEKEKPGEYNVLANLGTLYELMGENEKALTYIKKAVSINASSHRGSEWIHIKILEAKMQQKDADWWKTHSILNISEAAKPAATIMSDIIYQLKERLPFTRTPNALMAAILNESATYFAQQEKKEQAWILYKIASEYDPENKFDTLKKADGLEKSFTANGVALPDYQSHFVNNDELVKSGTDLLEKGMGMYDRYREREQEKMKAEKSQNTIFWIVVAGIVVALAVFLYYSLRKK